MKPPTSRNSSPYTRHREREDLTIEAFPWKVSTPVPTETKKKDPLFLLPESEQTDTSNLDDLESDTGNISLCLSSSTETGDQNFVVFIGKVETTVVGDESGDFFTVLDQLNTNTFSDSRVGLFGLDTDLKSQRLVMVPLLVILRRLNPRPPVMPILFAMRVPMMVLRMPTSTSFFGILVHP